MIKAKHFDASKVRVTDVAAVAPYSRRVSYDGGTFQVQLPPMLVSRQAYDLHGKFYVNVLVPEDSVVNCFITKLSTALHGDPPIARTTQDDTGRYVHVRLRCTLPPLIEGTEGLHHAKVVCP